MSSNGLPLSRAQEELLDPNHTKSPQHVVMFADGNILSWREFVVTETVAAFVIADVTVNIVMKSPMATGLPDEMAALISFVEPETPNPAAVAVLLPQSRIEQPLVIEGSDKLIAVPVAAFGMLTIPRQLQPYFF